MTTDRMALGELPEKGSDADLLRAMIGFVAQRLMALDVEGLGGAAHGARTPERTNNQPAQRLPRPAPGEPRRQRGAAPPQAARGRVLPRLPGAPAHGRGGARGGDPGQEADVQGVPTRSVDERVKAMGLTGIGKSQVSRLGAEIDERVNAVPARPIEGDRPYPWIDAACVKVRAAGRIIPVAVIIAVAVNTDGRREGLGRAGGRPRGGREPFRTAFLRGLTRRVAGGAASGW